MVVFKVKKKLIAIVGATGLVGRTLIKIFDEYFSSELVFHLYASEKSVGKRIKVGKRNLILKSLENDISFVYDFVFFLTDKEISKKYIKKFKTSSYVIDNSSAFRLDKSVPLIIPEINFDTFNNSHLIANPNCTTAICAIPIHTINEHYGVKSISVTTLQSVSGSGRNGIKALTNPEISKSLYGYDISKTCVPKIGEISKEDYYEEECKIIDEMRKILNNYELKISATCVRVPIKNCHSAVVSLSLKKPFSIEEIKLLLNKNNQLEVFSNKEELPTSTLAYNSNKIYVGRLRIDLCRENSVLFYVCGDNLRRGAAYNAYKIMESIIDKNDRL